MKKNILCLFEKMGLSTAVISRLSVQTGFIQRTRKINAVAFLIYLMTESVRGCVSCNDLAAVIQCESGMMTSRQAYHHKMGQAAVHFFEAVLGRMMQAKIETAIPSSFRCFRRILVQDSTIIKLPLKLMKIFSGVKNAHTQVCNARIQCVYDLLGGIFTHWAIHSYRQTDLTVAADLPVRSGDLILRDRGYFTPNEAQRIMAAKGDFISRYKHKTTLTDPQTGSEIDLFGLLKKGGVIDRRVLIGTENPVEVRLLAAEVCPEIASSRRRKAKKENKGHHPSQAVLFLLGYTIFLTSLPHETLSVGDFMGLYGLRWRIESIFKTWKSHFNFDKIHTVGENQLRLILMARFMVITLFYEKIYVPLAKMMAGKGDKELSVMKLMRYLTQNFSVIPHLLKAAGGSVKRLKVAEKYCTYDKRKRPDYAREEHRILMVMEIV
jgi:hypothetical protein